MAAISALVATDASSHKRHMEDSGTPTTPRAIQFSPSSVKDQIALPEQLDQESHDARPILQQTESNTSSKQAQSVDGDAMDVDDNDDNDSGDSGEGEVGGEDANGRKKKGQRFFCTGYPPCNLSFTRSEHLARHIRKHTGERPFQCHCNRRFSRLDNLRQHAQTVHVNEDIPTDSLAATGTRFQRQIRTDRIRTGGQRPRSGTMGSSGSHSRGHSRDLSISSIGSTSSNYSTVTEAKRRPPPLLMASDSSRPKLGLDPPSTPEPHHHHYAPHSPGLSTPTSATYSTTPGSPGFSSSLGSPIANGSRLSGYYDSRTTARRLSVPSQPNPFQPQYGSPYQVQYYSQGPPPSSGPSSQSSMYASPTGTAFNYAPGYQIPPGEDWRRRTWHPSTYTGANYNYGRPATSGLMYSQTPDAPHPAYAQHAIAAAAHAPRLPGIESFDHMQQRPATPPRRPQSPMRGDQITPQRQSSYPELDDNGQVAKPPSWSQQAIEEIRKVGDGPGPAVRTSDMGPPPIAATSQQQQQIAQEALQMQSSTKRAKRQGWYNGARTSPEDSSSSDGVPTPGASAVDVHPLIMPSSGFIEPQPSIVPAEPSHDVSSDPCNLATSRLTTVQPCLGPPAPISPTYVNRSARERTTSFGERSSNGGDMNRLEALVAVATSSNKATTGAR